MVWLPSGLIAEGGIMQLFCGRERCPGTGCGWNGVSGHLLPLRYGELE